MSGGTACRCGKRDRWRAYKRRHNRSAFNGGHWTPSRYTSVVCLACRAGWRTMAKFADLLPDWKGEEYDPPEGLSDPPATGGV